MNVNFIIKNSSSKSLDCTACGKSFKTSGMLKLHEAKRCNNKFPADLERETGDQGLETLQNVAYIENIDEAHFLDTDHEVRNFNVAYILAMKY